MGWSMFQLKIFSYLEMEKSSYLYFRCSWRLSPTDYIEFWGEINDGKPDKDLYRDPSFQLSDIWSLQKCWNLFFNYQYFHFQQKIFTNQQ
jgi:hypothetical protein